MSDAAIPNGRSTRLASASMFVATLVGIVVLIGFLLSFDLFLARVDRQASRAHAGDEYAEGLALLRDARPEDAAERFANAAAIDRSNVNYALALGEAMLREGRVTDAEATLRTLLDRAENDGAVNLTMAHVMVREGRTRDAKAYFHRAIFGRWGADSTERRRQARFELIDLLARTHATTELLAELLPFEDVPSDSVALRRRLGQLFMIAGSPARAANMFREVIRRAPDDAEAFAALGETALSLGNFRTARTDFTEAGRLRPGDTTVTGRLALTNEVLALDPMSRGLGSAERLARSQALLRRTLNAMAACGVTHGPAVDSARAILQRAVPRRDLDVSAEAIVNSAVEVWSERPAACARMAADAPLRIVLNRIAQ